MSLINDNEALLNEYQSWRGDSMESIVPNALSRKLNMVLAASARTLSFIGTELPKQGKLLLRPNLDTERALKEVNYATIFKVTVPVPTGLSTTYLSLAKCLLEDAQFLSHIYDESLKPAEKLLNQLFSSPDELKGTFKFPEFERLATRYKDTVALRKQLGGCFTGGNVTYANFGDVFTNNKEVKDAEDTIRELGKVIDKIDVDKVRKQIKTVESAASDLHRLMTSHEGIMPSSYMASKLTEMLFNVAEEAEFLGAVLTYHQSLFNTFQEVQSNLVKKLK